MKVVKKEERQDNLYYEKSYSFDRLATREDAEEFLKYFCNLPGVSVKEVNTYYDCDHEYAREPVRLGSLEEFLSISPSLDWDHINTIIVNGTKDGYTFSGGLVPSPYNNAGFFQYDILKKKEKEDGEPDPIDLTVYDHGCK